MARSSLPLIRRYLSPLRYPGGKASLAPLLGALIKAQSTRPATYVEPFAGGAGAALRLLTDEYIENIELNDLDRGIAAFWRSVFFHTDELADRVSKTKVTIGEWKRQRRAFVDRASSTVDLGFATFYLNRTNRSGILDARPIGGLDQTGKWLLDARFNRNELATRISFLGRYRNRVTIHRRDGIAFLAAHMTRHSADSFYYVDPPYLNHGADLYLDTMTWRDHRNLARLLTSSRARWVVTYDCDKRVTTELFPRNSYLRFPIAHTAAHQHVGTEYAVFSQALPLAGLRNRPRTAAPQRFSRPIVRIADSKSQVRRFAN